ncbi:MAG: ParB N-terminal domain-containing protein [Spirochaetales bacterium]|nr:ParB N-terminal domain-containing protein [Spirochaetales bacterium]
MQMRIDEIILRKRIRRDLGNLQGLSESLEKHGLINPIVVTHEKILIAGERRLESAKLLGWETIPVRIIEHPDRIQELEIEIDENIHRKAFTIDEAGDAFTMLDKLKNPGFFRRILIAIQRFFKKLKGFFKKS